MSRPSPIPTGSTCLTREAASQPNKEAQRTLRYAAALVAHQPGLAITEPERKALRRIPDDRTHAAWRQGQRQTAGTATAARTIRHRLSHFISSAIEECEHIGLVNVRRGVGRRPSLYALTWLPLCDGSEPSNGFLRRDDAAQAIIAAKKVSKLRKSFKKPVLATVQTALATNDCTNSSQADCQTAVTKPVATVQTAVTKMGAKQQSPSRKLLTTATPKGVWESGYGDASAASGEPDGRDVPIRDQPNPGKPNGRNHCNVVIPLLRTRTAE